MEKRHRRKSGGGARKWAVLSEPLMRRADQTAQRMEVAVSALAESELDGIAMAPCVSETSVTEI